MVGIDQSFGPDFFSYVMDQAKSPISSFAQVALPTQSGVSVPAVPNPMPSPMISLPGLMPQGNPIDISRMFPAVGDIMAQGNAGVQKNVQTRQAATLDNPNAPKAQPTMIGGGAGYAANVAKFQNEINQISREEGVPARVLAALIHIENGADSPTIVRPDSGAAGLMQVVGGPTDPLENIRAGARLLRQKQKMWGIGENDWANTAAAYFGAYDPSRGGVTEARDATGTNGNQYVSKFNSAYNLYPDTPQLTISTGAGAQKGAHYTDPASGRLARPTQFDPELSLQEQYAACGPAAAVAFAQQFGKNYSVRQAMTLAQQSGLWKGQMLGPQSTANLIGRMGVDAKVTPVDWTAAVKEVNEGRPLIMDTPGHIFYADGFDANSGAFHVGSSGKDLIGGSDWMTPQQIASIAASQGPVRAFITAK